MRQRILIDGKVHELDWLMTTHAGQALLGALHKTHRRPRCNCVTGGVEMYVACRGRLFYVSRMPGSGILHDPLCESVEDTNYLTGVTAYTEDVIVEREDGSLVVAFGDPPQSPPPLPVMSISGLFDLVIDQANLNRHLHNLGADKLTWTAARLRLLCAAESIFFRDTLHSLFDHIAIPPPFDKANSAQSQAQFEQALRSTPRVFICAPFKEMRKTPYGRLLILKHLANLKFWVSEEIGESAERRSCGTFSMDAPPRFALCLGEIHPAKNPGSYTVDSLSIRTTDAFFMPCSGDQAADAANQMRTEGASFLSPLRFDAPADMALADFALLNGEMTPIFITSATGNIVRNSSDGARADRFERNRAHGRIVS